ncbi:hypothetical protein TM48_04984 [Mycobacterium shottsii]|uniref:Transmembrane protein n=1 Tax=Mycobacterium shottsii TaxID=133549 RepID=A0A7I7L3Y2_9MYCO|nr:hypothetical protein [Mycobacterium shottsii]QYL30386.1 hypothetical protein TM48_04984 [Mycobacterium shottsii]BBX54756.1 hypothetical protein MSHO_01010 [Mycobacterium shottsii]
MPATLSQIQTWSTEHLIDAATYWTQTADRWEDAFFTMRNQAQSVTWHGAGGDALRRRTGAHLSVVSGKADQLRHAAKVARTGASDISAAQRSALYAVQDAQNAGFDVGEDLSVSYTDHSGTAAEQAARQARAEQMASEICSRAAQLEGADQKVAGQLTATAGNVGNATFKPAHNGNGIQLVDNTEQHDGPQPPPPAKPGSPPDPISSMLLPPTDTAPMSDATKQWVDNMVKALASRPPDDPIAVEARRLAYDAMHQPCNSAEWTAAVTGFAGSSAGALGTAIAIPAGPADWALLGAALLGVAGSGAGLVNCATK